MGKTERQERCGDSVTDGGKITGSKKCRECARNTVFLLSTSSFFAMFLHDLLKDLVLLTPVSLFQQ